ncbi:unnamed protein product [Orchesella dallaii]|uniref:RING-type domain-containing protein n=1 Tax=Orchesella dallaii TaxID=48710 RepID=A0ABP1RX94_9HEXA
MAHFVKEWNCIVLTMLFIGLCCFNVSVQSKATVSATESEWPLDFPENYTTAYLSITFNTTNGSIVNEISETGRYVMGANITSVSGVLVHVNSFKNGTINHYGCDPILDEPKEDWIALVKRGMCDFQLKLENAKKAVGIIVYDGGRNESLANMKISTDAIPVIFTYKSEGERIANLTDGGTRVFMNITVGQKCSRGVCDDNETRLICKVFLFAIGLVIVCLHEVYRFFTKTIQTFRDLYETACLAYRRYSATRAALANTQTRKVEQTDEVISDDGDSCVICMDLYKAGDKLRALTCGHEFHKGCVDRWLLVGHPKCPLCKMDIFSDIGVIITGREENSLNLGLGDGGLNSTEFLTASTHHDNNLLPVE